MPTTRAQHRHTRTLYSRNEVNYVWIVAEPAHLTATATPTPTTQGNAHSIPVRIHVLVPVRIPISTTVAQSRSAQNRAPAKVSKKRTKPAKKSTDLVRPFQTRIYNTVACIQVAVPVPVVGLNTYVPICKSAPRTKEYVHMYRHRYLITAPCPRLSTLVCLACDTPVPIVTLACAVEWREELNGCVCGPGIREWELWCYMESIKV